MDKIEVFISIMGTAAPLLAAAVTFFIKLIKSIKDMKEERKQRLWVEFAQAAVKATEALRAKQDGELTGMTKKEIAMNKVAAACSKNGVSFERDKISEIIESIIDLTKKVNSRPKDAAQAEVETDAGTTVCSEHKKIVLGNKGA